MKWAILGKSTSFSIIILKLGCEVNGYDISKNYSNEEVQDLIEKSPYYKATSNDIDWLSKVEMQGAIQKWVDHSISVTINIPNEATEELVNQLYVKDLGSGLQRRYGLQRWF